MKHDSAHEWFARTGKRAWATCPLTQNGVVRIVGNVRYPSSPGTPAAVAELLGPLLKHSGHEFWPDDISLLDPSKVRPARLLDSSQVTDTYLLALAVSHSGKLATFDKQIVTDAVIGGSGALLVI